MRNLESINALLRSVFSDENAMREAAKEARILAAEAHAEAQQMIARMNEQVELAVARARAL